MARRRVVSILGGGNVATATERLAESLGQAVAREGWVTLTGGRASGVAAAASRGARRAGGVVVGVLPFASAEEGRVSEDLDVALFTGIGDARNVLNVRSSDALVALHGGLGTISEVALALKAGKPVVLLGLDDGGLFARVRPELVHLAADVDTAMARLRALLA